MSLRFHIQFAWRLKYSAMWTPAKRFTAGPFRGSYSDTAAVSAVVTDRASAESVDTPNNAPANACGASSAPAWAGIIAVARTMPASRRVRRVDTVAVTASIDQAGAAGTRSNDRPRPECRRRSYPPTIVRQDTPAGRDRTQFRHLRAAGTGLPWEADL